MIGNIKETLLSKTGMWRKQVLQDPGHAECMVHTNFQHFKVRNSQELKEYSYVLQALLFTGAPVTGAWFK